MRATSADQAKELSVTVEDGQLKISIGIALLAFAVQGSDEWPDNISVTDIQEFANSMRRALSLESEDGITAIHRMLDKAAFDVLEWGDEGIDEGEVEQGISHAKAILDAAKADKGGDA